MAECKVDDCERRVQGHGWCEKHYARWRRWGDPLYVRPVRPMNPGDVFGELTIVSVSRDALSNRVAECTCSCGRTAMVRAEVIFNSTRASCGCLSRLLVIGHHLTHGMSGHDLYGTWQGMRARCTKPNHRAYHRYGGRGITVHEPWLNDAGAFIRWVETNLGPRQAGMSLDRIDNDGNYEPGNLRWATSKQQIANQSNKRRTAA